MLSAQVEYWKLQEQGRHNLETEKQGWTSIAETRRHNVETESLGWGELAEKSRHNVVSEQQGWTNIAETKRHNQATEYETARHNLQTEAQGWTNLQENERSHRANESIGWANVGLGEERNAQGWESLNYDRQRLIYDGYRAQAAMRQTEISQQQADTAQYTSEWQRDQGSRRLDLQFMGYGNESWRTEEQVEQGWGKLVLDYITGISREARGWYNSLTNTEF